MARNFGHEDAGLATSESLDEITMIHSLTKFLKTDDMRYLVGPKGSGKTLVLLKKALEKRKKNGVVCIPSEANRPVDRLDAAEHVGQKFSYAISEPKQRHLSWTAVWKHSILRSVLHHLKDDIRGKGGATVESKRFECLIDVDAINPLRPFHYYRDITNLLDSSPRDVLSRVRDDLNEFDQLLQTSSIDVHVFLDNLDDYYELEPDLWMHSMYGQFRAVREISQAHRHIHVYTSIRQDVYTQFQDEMRLQYYDYVAELEYEYKDLLHIFESRIAQLESDLLCKPALLKNDPWQAFFGDNTQIRNELTGDIEDVRDFIIRHTLGRPRDLIHMGTMLLNLRRDECFSLGTIREAVARAALDICKQYLAEVKPVMAKSGVDLKVFIGNHIHNNIMTHQEIDEVTQEYLETTDNSNHRRYAEFECGPFEALYDLGLLGIERRNTNNNNQCEQFFRPPSRGLEDRRLPNSERYFLHPILSYPYLHEFESEDLVVGQGLSLD